MKVFTIIAAALLIANSTFGLMASVISRVMIYNRAPELMSDPMYAGIMLWGLFGGVLAILVGVLAIILAVRATAVPVPLKPSR